MKVDLSKYHNRHTLKNQFFRILWSMVYYVLFRTFPSRLFNKWRIFLLKCFGAKIEYSCDVYNSVKIWAPWNLVMGKYSCLGPGVDCYNVDKIIIGDNTVISQKTFLCTCSHDITDSLNPLITAPVIIESQVWVAAECYVGMGVTIHEGAVIGAKGCVFKNIDSWSIVGGNPAKFIKKRIIIK